MAQLTDEFNPHYWLASHGIRDPYFVWAVSHGFLNDIDPPAHYEPSVQPALLPGVADKRSPPPPPRFYRSRPPNKRDVPAWNRETLKALAVRPRLQDRYVLR